MVIELVDIDSEKAILTYDFDARVAANNKLADIKRVDDIVLLAEYMTLMKREDDIIIDGKNTYVVALPPETNLDESKITIYVEKMNKKEKKTTTKRLGGK